MSDLRQAAQAVLNRWDSPNWEWKHYGSPRFLPTATLMSALRKALAEQQAEPVHGDIRALKYRIHELEGEVMGYKRMLDVAEAASQPQQQAEPVAHFGSAYINENGVHITTVLGPVAIPQDAKLYTASPQRKPLSDEQIDDIWVEHGCEGEDAYGFARAIEAAHHIQEPKS